MPNLSLRAKWTIAVVLVAVLIGAGLVWLLRSGDELPELPEAPTAEEELVVAVPKQEVIGKSVQGRNIEAYTYGDPAGDAEHIVFVGGIHGGYEWNSVVLAYQFMDYLEMSPDVVPANLAVTVIPSANPDGVYEVVGKEGRFTSAEALVAEAAEGLPVGTGRFNANDVDLNRNFACRWQPQSTWRSKTVSAGTEPFSEPEAAAIRDFVLEHKTNAFIFWHSQASAVYASECGAGILPETLTIMNAYASASGYRAVQTFDAYPVTGDVESWLASIGIPAITVELSTHQAVEWEKNLAGARALLRYYGTGQ